MIEEILAKIARFSPSAKFLGTKTEAVDLTVFALILAFGLIVCYFGPRLVELLLPALGFFGGCFLGLFLSGNVLASLAATHRYAKIGIILLVGLIGALVVRGLFSAFVFLFELGILSVVFYYAFTLLLPGHNRLPIALGGAAAFLLLLFLNPLILPIFVVLGRACGALAAAVTVYHFYPSKLALVCVFGLLFITAMIAKVIVPAMRNDVVFLSERQGRPRFYL